MTDRTTRELVDAFYEARLAGDQQALLDLLAPDATWIKPASLPVTRTDGGEAIVKALGARSNFDLTKPFAMEVERVLVDGDVAIVQHRVTATVKKTGEPYANDYLWIYEFADGRLQRLVEYADTLIAYRSMSWLFDTPAEAAAP